MAVLGRGYLSQYFLLTITLLSISTLFISNECEELQNDQMLKLFDSSFMLYITTKCCFELMLGSSRPEVFCKKVPLKSFAKFTAKYLCWSLFFKKVAGCLRPY